jgi:hypothetical protein
LLTAYVRGVTVRLAHGVHEQFVTMVHTPMTRTTHATPFPNDVLCLSHLRWDFVFQRPNHLMTRWAREHRVFFVEEPRQDAMVPRLHEELVAHHVHVLTPHLPPNVPPADLHSMTRTLLMRLMERENVISPLLWFYTPLALDWIPRIPGSPIVYDCMDELANFHGAASALKERELELFRLADLVFTGGYSLYEAKRKHHARVFPFPSSVDTAHFRRAREPGLDPDDQASIPHPRVGFFGVIDERMDLDLLRELATRRPLLQFVLVGPVAKIDPE